MIDPTSSPEIPVQHCGGELEKWLGNVDHVLFIAVDFSGHFVVCNRAK